MSVLTYLYLFLNKKEEYDKYGIVKNYITKYGVLDWQHVIAVLAGLYIVGLIGKLIIDHFYLIAAILILIRCCSNLISFK